MLFNTKRQVECTMRTVASFSISTVSNFARTKIRTKSILAVGIDITDSSWSTALIDVWQKRYEEKNLFNFWYNS